MLVYIFIDKEKRENYQKELNELLYDKRVEILDEAHQMHKEKDQASEVQTKQIDEKIKKIKEKRKKRNNKIDKSSLIEVSDAFKDLGF